MSAGDLIGATPLLSALFHDEPSIEAFNMMGLDYNGVGNHEFDEGVDELLRMQNGGCHSGRRLPSSGDGFDGADFDFLAANVAYKDTGETIFPPYAIHDFPGGVKIAFVGMTLEGTPDDRRRRRGIATVDFLDEADTVNALVPFLKQPGRRDDRRPAPRGRQRPGRTAARRSPIDETTINSCAEPEQRAGARRSSSAWTTRSTSSSPATPTGPSTA